MMAKVTNLDKEDGNFTKNDPESCQVFSDFFKSMFTKEDGDELPEFHKRTDFVKNNIVVTFRKC